MTVLQTIRPTLFAPPLTTRRKGQGPKAKPAATEPGLRLSVAPSRRRRRDGTLAVLENGMPPVFQVRTLRIFQWTRSRWMTRRRRRFPHRIWLQLRLVLHRFRPCVHRRRFHRRVCQLRVQRPRVHRARIYLRRRVAVAESGMMTSGTSRRTL